jgi:hypothetical protein
MKKHFKALLFLIITTSIFILDSSILLECSYMLDGKNILTLGLFMIISTTILYISLIIIRKLFEYLT